MKLPFPGYLNLASDLIPVGMGLARRRNWGGEASLFFVFVALGLVVEVATFTLAQLSIHNLWILHVYALLEYIILILIFAGWQKEAKRPLLRHALYASIGVYGLIWILAKIEFEKFASADQYTHSISAIVFVAFSLFTLVNLARTEGSSLKTQAPIYRTFQFWVLVGILIFFAGNTFLFGLGELISSLAFKDAVAVWTIHWWLNITANICYGVGFWYLKRV
jgi:hypothetical protein